MCRAMLFEHLCVALSAPLQYLDVLLKILDPCDYTTFVYFGNALEYSSYYHIRIIFVNRTLNRITLVYFSIYRLLSNILIDNIAFGYSKGICGFRLQWWKAGGVIWSTDLTACEPTPYSISPSHAIITIFWFARLLVIMIFIVVIGVENKHASHSGANA